jgi:ActR/RegA family two-component response regulator
LRSTGTDTLWAKDKDDILKLISQLKTQESDLRIVVATVSPTWSRARDALKAGAVDYIERSTNIGEIQKAIIDALNKPLPSEVVD